jgi:hypothetical protein
MISSVNGMMTSKSRFDLLQLLERSGPFPIDARRGVNRLAQPFPGALDVAAEIARVVSTET